MTADHRFVPVDPSATSSASGACAVPGCEPDTRHRYHIPWGTPRKRVAQAALVSAARIVSARYRDGMTDKYGLALALFVKAADGPDGLFITVEDIEGGLRAIDWEGPRWDRPDALAAALYDWLVGYCADPAS